jgi:transmembrane sensor
MDRPQQAQIEQDAGLRRAAEWFIELRSPDISGERIDEWHQWLTTDPAHRAAFDRIEAFWRVARQLPDAHVHWPTDHEVASDDYDGSTTITEWRRRRRTRLPPRPMLAAAAIAAATVALGWIGADLWPTLASAVLGTSQISASTRAGEMRTIELADGSSLSLSGRTRIVAKLTRSSREITLDEGEAFFQVAKDPARPFTVRSGTASVTALGTSFNVRRAADRTVVAVAEGLVTVAVETESPTRSRVAGSESSADATAGSSPRATRLKAGEQTSIGSLRIAPVLPIASTAVGGWRQGRLQYIDEPLGTVAQDLSRHSSRQIYVVGATAQLRVTGIVFQHNIDGWLNSLQETLPLQSVYEADGRIKLEPR